MVQHRALRDGAALATTLGYANVATEYSTQADNILCFLQVGICNVCNFPKADLVFFAVLLEPFRRLYYFEYGRRTIWY
jgi:hypothetical protein